MDLYRLHFSSGTTESHARDAKEPPLILGRGLRNARGAALEGGDGCAQVVLNARVVGYRF